MATPSLHRPFNKFQYSTYPGVFEVYENESVNAKPHKIYGRGGILTYHFKALEEKNEIKKKTKGIYLVK